MSSNANISNLLGLARTAQLAGNHEEAMSYFNRVLEADPTISDAWIGKGNAAAWQSTLVNIRLTEALVAFGHGIATAPEEEKADITAQAVGNINGVVAALYEIARQHLEQFVAVLETWTQYINQVAQMLNALDEVRGWAPLDRTTLENIVHLCKDNIEGITYNDPYDYNASKAWHLSPEYEALVQSRLDTATEALRSIDPTYAAPAIQKKAASDCFVVTAAMGDADHPTVELIRGLRDRWLAQRAWGRRLIRHYYRVGPRIADVIRPSPVLRKLSLLLIVMPLSVAARLLGGRRP